MIDIGKFSKEELEKYKDKIYGQIFEVADNIDAYREYCKNISINKFYLGFSKTDKLLGGVRPGQVVSILAPTNVGKTTIALNIARNQTPEWKEKFLLVLISMEESKHGVFERYLQMHYNLSTEDLEKIYATDDKFVENSRADLDREFSGLINVVYRIHGQDLMAYLQIIEKTIGKKIGAVILDHLNLIKNDTKHNDVEKTADNMQTIKEVALHLNYPIINLSHVGRSDAKDKKGGGINLFSGKGSGEIENSSQILFTLQRIDEIGHYPMDIQQRVRRQELDLLKFKIEKKKQGQYGEVVLALERPSLRMTEYTQHTKYIQEQAF